MDFHAHVYYDWDHRDEALALRQHLMAAAGDLITVHSLIDRQVGPHLWPMFEIDFSEPVYQALTDWLEWHHGNLSVLIHPLTDDDIANHGPLARWIGQELPLNWARLGLVA